MKTRELVAEIEKKGYRLARTMGKHHIYKHEIRGDAIPVPKSRELKNYTARGILKAVRRAEQAHRAGLPAGPQEKPR